MTKQDWDTAKIELDMPEAALVLSMLNSYMRLTTSIESKESATAFSAHIRAKVRKALSK